MNPKRRNRIEQITSIKVFSFAVPWGHCLKEYSEMNGYAKGGGPKGPSPESVPVFRAVRYAIFLKVDPLALQIGHSSGTPFSWTYPQNGQR